MSIGKGDNGIYDATNKAYSAFHGDVIGILNSDDIYAGRWCFVCRRVSALADPEVRTVYVDPQ